MSGSFDSGSATVALGKMRDSTSGRNDSNEIISHSLFCWQWNSIDISSISMLIDSKQFDLR